MTRQAPSASASERTTGVAACTLPAQLAARAADFKTAYGFEPWVFDFAPISGVDYKGTTLTRHPSNGNGVMTYSTLTTATVLAEAVKAALVKRGIPPARILTVGHGADKPVGSNDSFEGRRRNRRIEFRLLTAEDLSM